MPDKRFSDILGLYLPVSRKIRLRSELDFEDRARMHSFVRKYFRENGFPGAAEAKSRSENMPLWTYWATGFDTAPDIVRACHSRLQKENRSNKIIALDDSNLGNYIEIPGFIFDRLASNKTHFSDVLRLNLLARHGGIWIDSTCFVVGDTLDFASSMLKSGFFAYARNATDQYMLSNWFLAARPNNLISLTMRNILHRYWEEHETLAHYFMFHYFFEAAYNLCSPFRQVWDGTEKLEAYAPHELQGKLGAAFDRDEWNRILRSSRVHKLSYKIEIPAKQNSYF